MCVTPASNAVTGLSKQGPLGVSAAKSGAEECERVEGETKGAEPVFRIWDANLTYYEKKQA